MSNNNKGALSNPGVLILVGCCTCSAIGSITSSLGCSSAGTTDENGKPVKQSTKCEYVSAIAGILTCLVCWYVILKLFKVI